MKQFKNRAGQGFEFKQIMASGGSMFEPLEGRLLMSTVYSAAAGLSPTKNPNPPWAYGYSSSETSAFVAYTTKPTTTPILAWSIPAAVSGTPAIIENVSSTTQPGGAGGGLPITPGELIAAPGFSSGKYSVIQFTAPAAATYSIAASFAGQQTTHKTTDVHILYNEKSLYNALVVGSGTTSTVSKDVAITGVAKGATIDFIVGTDGGSGGSGNTIVNATITETIPSQGTIAGTVFVDTNANGKLDTGEKGLAGETVYIDTKKTGVFATGDPTAVTNSTGAYSFTNLTAGTYLVREKLPTGFKLTAPTAGDFSVTLTAGQTVSGDNFADAPATATLSGTVFNDVNGNGKKDVGEEGLGLWTVYIDLKKDGKDDAGDPSVTTNILGAWSFSGLVAGTYVIRVVPVTGSVATTPAGGMLTIALTAGQSSVGNLFGEKTTA